MIQSKRWGQRCIPGKGLEVEGEKSMSDVIEQFINIHVGHWPAKTFHSHSAQLLEYFQIGLTVT